MAVLETPLTIEEQISALVRGLSEKNKEAVLTVVRAISEAEKEADFDRKWADAVPLEEARAEVHQHIKTLKWKEKSL